MKTSDERSPSARSGLRLLGAALALIPLAGVPAGSGPPAATQSLIIQAASAAQAGELVARAGGSVTHELGIIDAVAAQVTAAQARRLASEPSLARSIPTAVPS